MTKSEPNRAPGKAGPSQSGNPSARTTFHPAWICLLLAAVTLAVYGRVVGFEFINYDDTDYVVENAPVQAGLTWRGVGWALGTRHAGNWHPLTWVSHMLDVEVFGAGAGGPHAVNLALHTAKRGPVVPALESADRIVVAERACRWAFRLAPVARRIGRVDLGAEGCAERVFLHADAAGVRPLRGTV